MASPSEPAHWLAKEVQPHEPALRGYLRRQFPSLDPDDVVQESYLKLLKAGGWGGITSAKAYFFSIARNTALTLFRRSRIYSDVPVNELPESFVLFEGPDAAQLACTHNQLESVAIAIDQLPSRCREIVNLAMLHGLSTAEIAARLGLAETTVQVQMARGIKKCSDYLDQRSKLHESSGSPSR